MTRQHKGPLRRDLFFWHIKLSRVDCVDNVVRRLSLDCAPNRLCGPENFPHRPSEILGKRLVPKDTSNRNDLVKRNVARMFDVFLLLSIAWRLCDKS